MHAGEAASRRSCDWLCLRLLRTNVDLVIGWTTDALIIRTSSVLQIFFVSDFIHWETAAANPIQNGFDCFVPARQPQAQCYERRIIIIIP